MSDLLSKVLAVITQHAQIAQGRHSFGPKIGGGSKIDTNEMDEVGEGELPGMPGVAKTPGEELNASVQDHVLGHQDHELTDDEFLPGAEPIENEPEPDEEHAPKEQQMGFMSTNAPRAPSPRSEGIHETAKRRRGRPRGSKA